MLQKKLVLISTCWHTGTEQLYAAVRTEFSLLCGQCYEAIFCPQGELFAIDACRRQKEAYLKDVRLAGSEVAQGGRIRPETQKRLDRPILSDETFEQITLPHWQIVE